MRALSLFLLLFSALLVPASAKVEVSDAEFGFSFELPLGFKEVPKETAGQPNDDVIHRYAHPALAGQGAGVTLIVKRLHRTLGTQPAEPPNGRGTEYTSERWKTFRLPVEQVAETEGNEAFLTYRVEAPLAPEAMQISVRGSAAHERKLRLTMQSVLATLNGPTTWTATSHSAARAATPAQMPVGPKVNHSAGTRPAVPRAGTDSGSVSTLKGILWGVLGIALLAGMLWLRWANYKRNAEWYRAQDQKILAMSNAKIRGVGLLSICLGLTGLWPFVIQPLRVARDEHPAELPIHETVVFMIPTILLAGLALTIFGKGHYDASRQLTRKLDARSIIILGALTLPGLLFAIWFRAKLNSMGYAF